MNSTLLRSAMISSMRRAEFVKDVGIESWAPTRSSTGQQIAAWTSVISSVPCLWGVGFPVSTELRRAELVEAVATRKIVLLIHIDNLMSGSMRVKTDDGLYFGIIAVQYDGLGLFVELSVRRVTPEAVPGQ